MHRGIVPHEYFIDQATVHELREMDFVFLCMDKGSSKRVIVEKLEEWGIRFIDVGMGIYVANECLHGLLRTTTSTPGARDHVREHGRINFGEDAGNDEYASNIQVADLNALNAALAVIKWKKLFGFYGDTEHEHNSVYALD